MKDRFWNVGCNAIHSFFLSTNKRSFSSPFSVSMDYDDDSDCPSVQGIVDFAEAAIDDIDDEHNVAVAEDNAGDLEEAEEQDGGNAPPLPDVPIQEVDDLLTSSWRYVSSKSVAQSMKVDIAVVDDNMFGSTSKQAHHVMKQVSQTMRVLELRESSSSEPVQYTNCFLPLELWVKLQSEMNRKLPETSPRVSMRELELLFRLFFALGAYSTSFSFVVKHLSSYPMIATIVNLMPRGETRIRELIQALDPSDCSVSKSNTDEWFQPFRRNKFVTEIEALMSSAAAEIGYQPGFDICIDDDKVRLDSMKKRDHIHRS